MHYYLAPYEWRDLGGFEGYCAPDGVVGSVDLRPLGQQSGEGGGVGFFAARDPLSGLTPIASGDLREINTTAAMRSAWQSLTGVRTQGAKLIDLLWDHLTEGADPEGAASCCPLMPTRTLDLELHLGGHSLIKGAKLDKASRHYNKVLAVEKRGYRSMLEQVERGTTGRDDHRKLLDTLLRKYGESDEAKFIPAGLPKEKRLKHETTKTETWPTNGAVTSGQDQTWTSLEGTAPTVSSNAYLGASGATSNIRMEYDFASADHYAQTSVISGSAGSAIGVIIRKDSTATLTHYLGHYAVTGTAWQTYKRITGTYTLILTATTLTLVSGDIVKLEASGSTITRYRNGASQDSGTDTAISAGTRTGIRSFGNGTGDNFEAGDVGAVVGSPWYAMAQM